MSDPTATTAKDGSDRAAMAWDMETDPANPHPNIWPECQTCGVAFAYKRAMSLAMGWVWCWQRECKHKSSAVLMTADGPYEPPASEEADRG